MSNPAAPSGPALLARLWREGLGRYWPRIAGSLVFTAVYAASASAIPIGVEWINSAFTGGESERFDADVRSVLIWGPVLVVALGAANATSQYVQSRLSLGAALRTLRDLQRRMFSNLLALDLGQVREDAAGTIVTRFTSDPFVLRETMVRVSNAVRDVLTLLALCGTMIWYDWVLFLVVLGVYPLVGLPVARIGKRIRETSRTTQNQIGDLTALLSETIGGARMVKTFRLEPYEQARADDAFEERLRLGERLAFTKALNEPLIFFIGSIALAVVVAVVALRVQAGAIDGPQFISFIIALLLLSQPARGLGTLNAVVQEGLGALERIFEFMDEAGTIEETPDAAPLPTAPPRGRVAFETVSFAYGENAPAVQGLDFVVEPGRTVALVGESGAGKSTVFNLIPRLYDATEGRVRIDGVDVREARLSSVRDAVAVVSQDVTLFDDTVRANIALGRAGATEAEIIAAAEAAAADGFIRALPEGYETRVGEGGSKLSGGQRQRIALARAFLKDAPILLLDEATSALDAESERQVQAALARLSEGRTTFVIAHRLATVRDADEILVMDRGRVVERGRHEELVAAGGVYARLAALQF
ncbi:MAG: ABC transporter ATP-binding protein, partial [Pseudomonadota bacterium]